METEEKKKSFPLSTIILIILVGLLFFIALANGQELTPLQQDLLTIDNLDPNYIPINKLFEKIKLKDKDTAEAYTLLYGKLEYIQKVCER